METKIQRRDPGWDWFHALPALMVERPCRQSPTGAGICLGRKLLLQTCLRSLRHSRLLAHKYPGVLSDAQRRAESAFKGATKIFPARFAERPRNFPALHGAYSGAAETRHLEAA